MKKSCATVSAYNSFILFILCSEIMPLLIAVNDYLLRLVRSSVRPH